MRAGSPPYTERRVAAIHACAALVALGLAAGLPPLAREICYHIHPASTALSAAGLALCAGVILGLWYPRRLIQRRLAQTLGGPSDDPALPAPAAGDGPEMRFAARLTAALHAPLTAAWLLASGVVAGLESWRGLLANSFHLPFALFLGCVTLPALLALVLIGVCATVALVAVHGWYRLATRPHTNVARLWRSLLAATLAGSLTAWLADETSFLLLLAVGGALAAGVVALGGPSGSTTRPRVRPDVRETDGATRLSLLNVALAGSVVTLSALWTITHRGGPIPSPASTVFVVALGAVCGAGLGRILLRTGSATGAAPFLVLTAIALSALVSRNAERGPAVLAPVSASAAACVILVARRVSLASGSVQYSLAWTGGALTCGAGVAFLANLAPLGGLAGSGIGPYWGLAMALTAVVTLLLDQNTRPWLRWPGTAVAGLAAVVPLLFARSTPPGLPSSAAHRTSEHHDPAVTLGREWLRTGALCWEALEGGPGARAAAGPTVWNVDSAGPRVDVLFVPAARWWASSAAGVPRATERRLLCRAARSVLPGGRLVVELVPGRAADLGAQPFPKHVVPAGTPQRLGLATPAGRYEAIIFGPNVADWLAQRALPHGCTMRLSSVTLPDSF